MTDWYKESLIKNAGYGKNWWSGISAKYTGIIDKLQQVPSMSTFFASFKTLHNDTATALKGLLDSIPQQQQQSGLFQAMGAALEHVAAGTQSLGTIGQQMNTLQADVQNIQNEASNAESQGLDQNDLSVENIGNLPESQGVVAPPGSEAANERRIIVAIKHGRRNFRFAQGLGNKRPGVANDATAVFVAAQELMGTDVGLKTANQAVQYMNSYYQAINNLVTNGNRAGGNMLMISEIFVEALGQLISAQGYSLGAFDMIIGQSAQNAAGGAGQNATQNAAQQAGY
jgi:hypothetical protein